MTTTTESRTTRQTLTSAEYTSEAVYQVERDRIWFSEWVYVGRSELVDEPGKFFTVDIAGESILVTRNSDGELRGFYNVCRHRGSVLCEEAKGTTKAVFQCPYHAWSYDLDGALVSTPRVGTEEVDRSSLPLKRVHIDEWQGFLFLNLSRETPPSLRERLEAHYDSPLPFEIHELDRLKSVHLTETVVAANWKILIENYNECLHCPIIHPELIQVIPAYKKGWIFEKGRTDGGVALTTGGTSYSNDPRARRHILPHMDEEQSHSIFGSQIFPNMFLDIAGSNVVVTRLVPEGPHSTRVFSEYLFLPEDIASEDFDPQSVIDFCELVAGQDFAISERVQRGVKSRGFDHGVYPEKDEWVHLFNEYYREVRGPLP